MFIYKYPYIWICSLTSFCSSLSDVIPTLQYVLPFHTWFRCSDQLCLALYDKGVLLHKLIFYLHGWGKCIMINIYKIWVLTYFIEGFMKFLILDQKLTDQPSRTFPQVEHHYGARVGFSVILLQFKSLRMGNHKAQWCKILDGGKHPRLISSSGVWD